MRDMLIKILDELTPLAEALDTTNDSSVNAEVVDDANRSAETQIVKNTRRTKK